MAARSLWAQRLKVGPAPPAPPRTLLSRVPAMLFGVAALFFLASLVQHWQGGEGPAISGSSAISTSSLARAVEDDATAKPKPKKRAPGQSQSLPAWSAGHRFYILGALLTRDQIDARPYLDIFIAGRKMFDYSDDVLGVWGLDPEWEAARLANAADPSDIVGKGNGRFFCYEGAEAEASSQGKQPRRRAEATVVPVLTTVDGNANGVTQIIRCPLSGKFSSDWERDLSQREGSLSMTLSLKERGKTREEEVATVELPWRTRTAGYFNYHAVNGADDLPRASKLDPWKAQPDKLHLCVPGLFTEFRCPLLDTVWEFVEYHLSMGVGHIHLGVDYPWGSEDMERVLLVLGPYIEEGKLSVMSTQSVRGPKFVGTDQYKLWHLNACLAYTKGLATWVGVWDADELLVPHHHHHDHKALQGGLPEAIEAQLQLHGATAEGTCHLRFTSYHFLWPDGRAVGTRTWLGQLFADRREDKHDDTWQKTIVSNRNVYYTGFHMPGACRAKKRDWAQQVTLEDGIDVDPSAMAMHHYRAKLGGSDVTASNVLVPDEYASLYFPQVVQRLKARGAERVLVEHCIYDADAPPDMSP